MPLLYYWRRENYERDLAHGLEPHLNQANPLLHSVPVGDSVWAFTRDSDGAYVLAAELVVADKTINPPGYGYGEYRVWADLERSRYFRVRRAPTVEPLIRSFGLATEGAVLGRCFQGRAAVRTIGAAASDALRSFAAELPREPKAPV